MSLHPKYPHTPGITRLAYSRNGEFLFTVGSNALIRKFTVGSVNEPETLEFHDKNIYGVSCGSKYFVTCSQDGTAVATDVATNALVATVFRSSLPLREVEISPDGEYTLICGDDGTAKLVQCSDSGRSIDLPKHPQGVKHVAYGPLGNTVATSCTDGNVRFFSISSEIPQEIYKLEGVVPAVSSCDEEKSTKVYFNPQDQTFAVPTKTFDIAIYEMSNWTEKGRFQGHSGPINDIAWSPNGYYLASSGADNKLIIWSTRDRSVISTYEVQGVLSIAWHPAANVVSFTTNRGQLYTLAAAIPSDGPLPYGRITLNGATTSSESIRKSIQMEQDDLFDEEIPEDIRVRAERELEAELAEGVDEADDWIVDDDGAGYTNGKGNTGQENGNFGPAPKRHKSGNHGYSPNLIQIAEPFSPGNTPWRGNRRYLTTNSIGYVWTVMQEDYNTVTVSFFDRGTHREYHFTDYAQYDNACLSEEACVFSNEKGKVLVRFHDGFGDNWELSFDDGMRSVAISDKVVVICTNKGYVRVFNLFGTPIRVLRQSRYPIIACTAKGSCVMTVGAAIDGSLKYSIEDASNGTVYQRDQSLEIPFDGKLQNLFFSEQGDPCIFDSRGELLVLMHWRNSTQAHWVPLLDTKSLAESEGRNESYWSLGLREKKFMCIILKNSQYPSLPMPVFSEFTVGVPVESSTEKPEQDYLTGRIFYELHKDREESDNDNNDDSQELSSLQLELDKFLLYQLQASCKERKLNKSLGIVRLIHKDQALEAAAKIALRFEMTLLADRINELRS
jgi:chromosome transmission fidelity protein 4